MKRFFLGFTAMLMLSAPTMAEHHSDTTHTAPISKTIVLLNNAGEETGSAVLTKASGDGVLIHIKASDLPAGQHGMHFHHTGSCSDHQHFKEAGGHIGKDKPHGFLHPEGPHAGNLPNLIVANDGSVEVELYSNLVTFDEGDHALYDADGSALMVHINQDDHVTQPIGGSGPRIACGVIK